jgi:hypothetical protein
MKGIVNRQPWQNVSVEKNSQSSQEDVREFVLIEENVVVGRTTCTKDSPMTLEVEVEFHRVDHIAVDNRAGEAISASVALVISAREEANMVSLANDNKRDCRFYLQPRTRFYMDIRRRTRRTGDETNFE